VEIVSFQGWKRNARLTCGDVEMIVTLEVGPRIIAYNFVGEPNQLFVKPATAGAAGGTEFRSYGGHRLWIAPEESPRTFQPDNEAVEYTIEDGWHVFTARPDTFHIQKQFRVRPAPETNGFQLVHRIYNHSGYDAELALWTPTQFAAGGECIFPQAPFIPHSDKVLPARPLVLWNYTHMDDPRWTWGRSVVRLKQLADMGSTKVGALVEQGYVAYCNLGHTHLRRFDCSPEAKYPDFGCNFETYSRGEMLEVETLGPMLTIPKKGGFADHRETWYLLRDETAPSDDAECGAWLAGLAELCPL
jgi:hypothetical protein